MITPLERRHFAPIERLTRAELEALQLRKLQRLLSHNFEHNAFYRNVWRRHGLSGPEEISSLADFRRKVPAITKDDVLADQEEFPPFGRRLGVDRGRVRKVHTSSGTSGRARETWGLTQADVELSARGHVQSLHWVGLVPGDVCITSMPNFFSAGQGSRLGTEKMGLVTFEVFGLPIERVLELAEQFPPSLLLFPVSVLGRALAERSLVPREMFPALKALPVHAVSTDALPHLAEEWGTRTTESYGCTQAGNTLGSTCEAGSMNGEAPGMAHFFEDRYIVECLDRETQEPCEPGAECEIVITTLDREASPAIRYRIHDRAVFLPNASCDCGRPFHGFLPGTISRWDDMLKIKGVNVWPSTIDEIVLAFPAVADYRGVVYSDPRRGDCMEIRLFFREDAGETGEARTALMERVRTEVKHRTLVTPVIVESDEQLIPTSDLKPRRWTDQRRAAPSTPVPA